MSEIDDIDRKILGLLQTNALLSVNDISEQVHLSRNACWRRIKILEERGIIKDRITRLDATKIGLPLMAMVLVKAGAHDVKWLDKFRQVVQSLPNVTAAYRMTGDLDYVLHVRLRDMADYDRFYKTLIGQLPVLDISASFVMDEIKDQGPLMI